VLVLLAACTTGPSGPAGIPAGSAGGSPPGGIAGASPGGSRAPGDVESNDAAATEDPTDEPTEPPGPSPQDVVQSFYDWYLAGRPMAEVVARPELSPALVTFLRGFDEPYDPFACTEVLPASILAVTSSLSGQTAIVSTVVSADGSNELPGPPIDVVLSGTGEWQLEFVGCEA